MGGGGERGGEGGIERGRGRCQVGACFLRTRRKEVLRLEICKNINVLEAAYQK